MNPYTQDAIIPIYITLQYDFYFLKFPVNPESIKKERASNSNKNKIEGIGEVSDPTTPDLAKIVIESFFWYDMNAIMGVNPTPPSMYVTWLERWQKSKKPANLIVTRLNYSMQVTCENFVHWVNAGEEKDVYFTLELQEYRPHAAKKLGFVENKNLLQSLQEIKNLAFPPVLVDIPRPSRHSILKKSFTNPYTVKKNETLMTIAKKITGSSDNWKELYDKNKIDLGNVYVSDNEIPMGTKLTLPDSWVNDKSYNIIQGEL